MERIPNNQNQEQNQTPDSQAEGWDLAMAAARKEHDKQERLAQAMDKASEEGKEEFDYKKLCSLYWRKGSFSQPLEGDEPESMQEYFAEEYYLNYPEIKTIEEFAAELEKRDASLDE